MTSVQRRRRWSVAEKVRLVEEAMQPGISVSYVARRAGISPPSSLPGSAVCSKTATRQFRLTKMLWTLARSANWRSGCSISSACWARRPWKPRASRKPLNSLAQKNGRRRCCRGAIPGAIPNECDC
ncbi:MAG: hypothetical protein EOR30_29820 [Mesorhizobium sp.]|nr:MAG: hypothetical protein EOR14_31725 [Mesorhizobium sp.]RWI63219.1 MAG: hypothetical protein EOR17_29785 [Mesorhizobium sp.]RWI82574.1 MAG: hypothetical protein EOR20_26620 [Mesorhizobium sp.]RWJ43957.1 MAG: hypothetical protein EOR30_29820 [Mesorhizobium sp.]RWJ57466.1 MAG: hypothetical protein EOR32_29750 [Mesorhizobium sp.]